MKKHYDGLEAYVINFNSINTKEGFTASSCVEAIQITYNGQGCEDCFDNGQMEAYNDQYDF